MSKSPLSTTWLREYCAPVVAVIPTAEVENISLKNGMLFHDLLRAFCHLDVNSTIRSCNQVFQINDAHIRFERGTELIQKSSSTVEELLRSTFTEYDLAKFPATMSELKAAPPHAWTRQIEQIISRSMSFSEYEMSSHPIFLLTVVSTTDYDVVECMQEITSHHHTPQCLMTGQYESDVHRVYLLVHDPHEAGPTVDPMVQFRKLQARFPPTQTKLLILNSLPPQTPNLHQPDVWSAHISPLYFPQHAPTVTDEFRDTIMPRNPLTGMRVYGSRLSMEDFMSLRDFCLSLYHQEIVPYLEKKINNLSRIVADNRKGVKNVFKSFWRKPREELELEYSNSNNSNSSSNNNTNGNGSGGNTGRAGMSNISIRYKADRIETQILLLADMCFMCRDYESALSMYKMAREDYRADKSMIHLAYATLMSIACHLYGDPNQRRDLHLQLDGLIQITAMITDNAFIHCQGFFTLLASDMYVHHCPVRAPVEAATALLSAAASTSKFDLLSGLLIERAALFFLQAGYYRKFVFHEVLCGLKIRNCGYHPALHCIVTASCALLALDGTRYGGLRSKLLLLVAGDMKTNLPENVHQYILLLLNAATAAIHDSEYVTGRNTAVDSIGHSVLNSLTTTTAPTNNSNSDGSDSDSGRVVVSEGWQQASMFDILENPYFVESIPLTDTDTATVNAATNAATGAGNNSIEAALSFDSEVMMGTAKGTAQAQVKTLNTPTHSPPSPSSSSPSLSSLSLLKPKTSSSSHIQVYGLEIPQILHDKTCLMSLLNAYESKVCHINQPTDMRPLSVKTADKLKQLFLIEISRCAELSALILNTFQSSNNNNNNNNSNSGSSNGNGSGNIASASINTANTANASFLPLQLPPSSSSSLPSPLLLSTSQPSSLTLTKLITDYNSLTTTLYTQLCLVEYHDILSNRSTSNNKLKSNNFIKDYIKNNQPFQTPMFEILTVKITLKNIFSIPITLSNICLFVSPTDAFETIQLSQLITIEPRQSYDCYLEAIPLRVGVYRVEGVQWRVMDTYESLSRLPSSHSPSQQSPKHNATTNTAIANINAASINNGTANTSAIITSAATSTLNQPPFIATEGLEVYQPFLKPPLRLQKTLIQRAEKQHIDNKILHIEVIPPQPLLHITVPGVCDEVLQGQLLKTTFLLKNEGSATACNIHIKTNLPCFLFFNNHTDTDNNDNEKEDEEEISESISQHELNEKRNKHHDKHHDISSSSDDEFLSFLPMIGQSCTVTPLLTTAATATTTAAGVEQNGSNNKSTSANSSSNGNGSDSSRDSAVSTLEEVRILPGETYKLHAWLRLVKLGPQNISILVTYSSDSGGSGGSGTGSGELNKYFTTTAAGAEGSSSTSGIPYSASTADMSTYSNVTSAPASTAGTTATAPVSTTGGTSSNNTTTNTNNSNPLLLSPNKSSTIKSTQKLNLRTSFVSFQTIVRPSVSLQVRLSSPLNLTHRQFVTVNIENKLTLKKDRDRKGSSGIIDYNLLRLKSSLRRSDSLHADTSAGTSGISTSGNDILTNNSSSSSDMQLDEGRVKVEGVMIFGSLKPFTPTHNSNSNNSTNNNSSSNSSNASTSRGRSHSGMLRRYKSCVASHSEGMSFTFPTTTTSHTTDTHSDTTTTHSSAATHGGDIHGDDIHSSQQIPNYENMHSDSFKQQQLKLATECWALPLVTLHPVENTTLTPEHPSDFPLSPRVTAEIQSSTTVMNTIIERYMCYSTIYNNNQILLNNAFEETIGVECEAVTGSGARSITQVRKENVDKGSSSNSSIGGGGGGIIGATKENKHTQNINKNNTQTSSSSSAAAAGIAGVAVGVNASHFLNESTKNTPSSSSYKESSDNTSSSSSSWQQYATKIKQLQSRNFSLSLLDSPTTLQELHDIQVQSRAVTVVVVWSCKWLGKIRTGFSFLKDIPLVAITDINNNNNNNNKARSATVITKIPKSISSQILSHHHHHHQLSDHQWSCRPVDYLQLSLSHVSTAVLTTPAAVVRVTVDIVNTCTRTIYVTVVAVSEKTPLVSLRQRPRQVLAVLSERTPVSTTNTTATATTNTTTNASANGSATASMKMSGQVYGSAEKSNSPTRRQSAPTSTSSATSFYGNTATTTHSEGMAYTTNGDVNSSSYGNTTNNNNNNTITSTMEWDDSLIWQGKTKHVSVQVCAAGTRTLEFYVRLTDPGVYDLNRFKVYADWHPGIEESESTSMSGSSEKTTTTLLQMSASAAAASACTSDCNQFWMKQSLIEIRTN